MTDDILNQNHHSQPASLKKKVLIIEDEDIMVDLIQKKLEKEGYQVTVARNGEEGLDLIRKKMPNLILLDIVMPKMNGFEVMEELNKDPELKKIPIIVISNSGQPVELNKVKEMGAKDWLIKTQFEPHEVLEKVIKQIGR